MPHDVYTLDDFDFDLPTELIAQHPASVRDMSRLFILGRFDDIHSHSVFSSLPCYLDKGDILVFNNTRVINARLHCVRSSGGMFELFLTRKIDDHHWHAIATRMKRLKVGEIVRTAGEFPIEIKISGRIEDEIKIETGEILTDKLLTRIGSMALPPYIQRDASEEDAVRYQTVFASKSGAVAAPTAGLHFTDELLLKLQQQGIQIVFITLNVSWGTFKPVREQDISSHKMHSETYILEQSAADQINSAREAGNRIIAVGTTSLRVLETTFRDGRNYPGSGDTDIFIYPPQKVQSVNCLLTNFHMPRSTLFMLVAAFAGYEKITRAYHEAISMRYRFFSYGDAMLII
jgi:S-adenosylmethionine:tRNA ribosyltransferase-isomerase